MPNIVTDILSGPVVVFTAPLGTTLPAQSLPAGGNWPSGWVSIGYTKEPVTMSYTYETENHEIEQSLGPIARRKTAHTIALETVLAEFSAASLQFSFGGDVTTVPAGAGQTGYEQLDVGDAPELPRRMWAFEGRYEDEDGDIFPVRLFIWIATAMAGGDLEFGKASGYAGTPLRVEGLSDMSRSEAQRLFRIERILEAAT